MFLLFGTNVADKKGEGLVVLAQPFQRRVLAETWDRFIFSLDLLSSLGMVGISNGNELLVGQLASGTTYHRAQPG